MYSLRAKVKFQIFTTLERGNQLRIHVNMITIEDTGASLRGDHRSDRLLSRGYPETDVVKIIGGNFMRVFPRSRGKRWMTIFSRTTGRCAWRETAYERGCYF